MEITRYYCDRCGKEIESEDIEQKFAKIFKNKYRFDYYDIYDPYCGTDKEEIIQICKECYLSFRKWLNKN